MNLRERKMEKVLLLIQKGFKEKKLADASLLVDSKVVALSDLVEAALR